tara:strand:- start:980 stop:1705 length:726 start_codon:yes stop_codon:yes gene_type:complete
VISQLAESAAFFTSQGRGQVWPGQGLSEYYCEFSPKHYHDQLFGQYQVHCPPDMLRAVDKRKAGYLAGRYCAREALEAFELTHFVILNAPDRSPIWPNGLLGSISHSEDHAIAVIGDDRYLVGLGTDIEPIIGDDAMRETQSQVLNPEELHLLECSGLSRRQLFTVLFSVKESFFKAAYRLVRGFFGFDAVSIQALDHGKGEVTFCLNETLHERLRQGDELPGRFKMLRADTIATLVSLSR